MSTSRRIERHPVLEFRRGKEVTIFFEGKPIKAYEGESLVAAIYAAGYDVFKITSKHARPRAPFCMIGKCGSCMLEVDGEVVRSCVTPVRDGMRVKRISGLPKLPSSDSMVKGNGKLETIETGVLIVGGGPAGMGAADVLASNGMNVTIVDDQIRLGGQLIKQTHIFFGSEELFAGKRGFKIAEEYERKLMSSERVKVLLNTTALGVFKEGVLLSGNGKTYVVKPKYILLSVGAFENFLVFENNDLPGVMGAGGAQTLMNLYGVRPGNEVLVVGSGNVGLIITYQLLQAGAEVKAIVEAAPKIGGWFVHAAKVRRYGVPIYLRHTVVAAKGKERVEAAVIAEVDERWEPIPGTEKEIKCDTILLAVGLTPNTELLRQFGVKTKYVPELGGLVPVRDKYLETNVPGIFVAGDVVAIEEATTAFLEGWIAAYSILIKHFGPREEFIQERERLIKMLHDYRQSPASAKIRAGWKFAEITSTAK